MLPEMPKSLHHQLRNLGKGQICTRFEANAKNSALHPELAWPRLVAEVLHRPIHRRWAQ
jgi:hypothetical protein